MRYYYFTYCVNNDKKGKVMKSLQLFDLDKTVVDSDHRTPYTITGNLDLNLYRELQTIENIKKDTLLPLSNTMQQMIINKEEVGIVTARRMIRYDYIMLRDNGLKPNLIGSRDKIHKILEYSNFNCLHDLFKSSDDEYKRAWFKFIKDRYSLNDYRIFMYDDNQNVLKVAKEEGLIAVDAIALNKELAKGTVFSQQLALDMAI